MGKDGPSIILCISVQSACKLSFSMGKDGPSIILCISVQSACKPNSAENEMVHEYQRTVSKVREVAPLRQPF